MDERKIIPVKIGNGKEVHRGYAEYDGYLKRVVYRHLCSTVNTKHINRRSPVRPLPENTPFTCQKCRDKTFT